MSGDGGKFGFESGFGGDTLGGVSEDLGVARSARDRLLIISGIPETR